MINKPNVEDLLKVAENRFELVNMIAKRARQIEDGDKAMIDCDKNIMSAITIASQEIKNGKIKKEE